MAFDAAKKANYLNLDTIALGNRLGVIDIATVLDTKFFSKVLADAGKLDVWGAYRSYASQGSEEPADDGDRANRSGSEQSDRLSSVSDYGIETAKEGLKGTSSLLQFKGSVSAGALGTVKGQAGHDSLVESVAKLVSAAVADFVPAASAAAAEADGAAMGAQMRGSGASSDAAQARGAGAAMQERGSANGRGGPNRDADSDDTADGGDDPDTAPEPLVLSVAAVAALDAPTDDVATLDTEPATTTGFVGMSFQSQKHVFSMNDILGGYDGVT